MRPGPSCDVYAPSISRQRQTWKSSCEKQDDQYHRTLQSHQREAAPATTIGIRRRRPTPATLFRVSDPQSPDDDPTLYQKLTGDAQPLKTKRPNPCPYIPPSMKAVQRLVQSHMQSLGSLSDSDDDDNEEGTDDTEAGIEESTSNEPEECVDCGVDCGIGDDGPPSNNLETLLNHTLLEDSADTLDTADTQKDKVCDNQVSSVEHP
ncbi:protein phosphatase 1 regulatory subunit 1B isoform 2-T2 [Anomaloglossus baeobatrachus]|uniref:protein phosphatase 1 regulatory subunit 1B isoform X2 n=1 Tax=Anomaloglossus baeobatrachus TaxID=238106 RepID=UPI003F4F9D82